MGKCGAENDIHVSEIPATVAVLLRQQLGLEGMSENVQSSYIKTTHIQA